MYIYCICCWQIKQKKKVIAMLEMQNKDSNFPTIFSRHPGTILKNGTFDERFIILLLLLLLTVEFNVIEAYPSYEGWLFILTDAPVASVRNPLHLYTTEVATTLR